MPKLRAALLCLITLLLALVPGGCWDAREINTLSLVSGIGVDAGQNPGQYDVTVQIRKIVEGKRSRRSRSCCWTPPAITCWKRWRRSCW